MRRLRILREVAGRDDDRKRVVTLLLDTVAADLGESEWNDRVWRHAEERWLSIALGFLRPLQNAGLHSKVDCVEIAEQRAIEALYVMLTASVTPPSVPAAVATDHQATPTTANLPALPTAPTPATSAPATSTPTPTLPNSIEARVQRAVTVSRGVWKVLRDSKERLADVLRDRPSTPPSG